MRSYDLITLNACPPEPPGALSQPEPTGALWRPEPPGALWPTEDSLSNHEEQFTANMAASCRT